MCLGRYESAIPFYEAALRVNPRDPQRGFALTQLGSVLIALKRYEDALDISRRATQLVPKFYFPIVNISICLANFNQWSEAKIELQRAISVQPSLSLKIYAENTSFLEEKHAEKTLEMLQQIGIREE